MSAFSAGGNKNGWEFKNKEKLASDAQLLLDIYFNSNVGMSLLGGQLLVPKMDESTQSRSGRDQLHRQSERGSSNDESRRDGSVQAMDIDTPTYPPVPQLPNDFQSNPNSLQVKKEPGTFNKSSFPQKNVWNQTPSAASSPTSFLPPPSSHSQSSNIGQPKSSPTIGRGEYPPFNKRSTSSDPPSQMCVPDGAPTPLRYQLTKQRLAARNSLDVQQLINSEWSKMCAPNSDDNSSVTSTHSGTTSSTSDTSWISSEHSSRASTNSSSSYRSTSPYNPRPSNGVIPVNQIHHSNPLPRMPGNNVASTQMRSNTSIPPGWGNLPLESKETVSGRRQYVVRVDHYNPKPTHVQSSNAAQLKASWF